MTIGQAVLLNTAQSGLVTDATSVDSIVVAITAPLVGSLTILDGNGNTVISKAEGQSGAFAVTGEAYRLEYSLSSASDLGVVTVVFRPV